MAQLEARPLREDLPFGTRISGLTRDTLQDPAVRGQIKALFEERGLIIFEDVEPTDKMMLALSGAIGPLQDVLLKTVSRVDGDEMPGVLEFRSIPEDANIFEIDGELVSNWTNWHFDAAYNPQINRGGVLRVTVNPPEGGNTGFVDGIQLYNAISEEMREKFRNLNIIYQTAAMYHLQRFAMPNQLRMVNMQDEYWRVAEEGRKTPRSVHPAIWQRSSGEHVLHAVPFQAVGIEGQENPEGDALLEELFQEMYAKMTPYWHEWKLTDMVAWDNWRFIHAAGGHKPEYRRSVRRTTIRGDYGLGYLADERDREFQGSEA